MLACTTTSRDLRPASAWIRTELYFGLTRPGGARISTAEWDAFVQASVVPRFPDGFTEIAGDGEYRGHDGQTHREPSEILIVLRPRATASDDDAKLDALAREYDARFQQESVLRSDSPADAQFIAPVPAGR